MTDIDEKALAEQLTTELVETEKYHREDIYPVIEYTLSRVNESARRATPAVDDEVAIILAKEIEGKVYETPPLIYYRALYKLRPYLAPKQQPTDDEAFYKWCESVRDAGHEVQPNSATAKQRRLGWDAAIAAMTPKQDKAYEYACYLFKLYAPQCAPLSDTVGVLTQIDNYIAGLHSPKQQDGGLVEKIRAAKNPDPKNVGYNQGLETAIEICQQHTAEQSVMGEGDN